MFSDKMHLVLVIIAFYSVACLGQTSDKDNNFAAPIPQKCADRPKEFQYDGKNFFFSDSRKVDWWNSRNLCRKYCMELVSLESQAKNDFIIDMIKKKNITSIWTAGRLCDFKGCDDPDLEPKNINGWFWSTSRNYIDPTNQNPPGWKYNPWSQTGHKKIPQPDNAEYDINQSSESCLSVLNNVYKDGITWHDASCYHEKAFICEDSDDLLKYVAARNPEVRL